MSSTLPSGLSKPNFEGHIFKSRNPTVARGSTLLLADPLLGFRRLVAIPGDSVHSSVCDVGRLLTLSELWCLTDNAPVA